MNVAGMQGISVNAEAIMVNTTDATGVAEVQRHVRWA